MSNTQVSPPLSTTLPVQQVFNDVNLVARIFSDIPDPSIGRFTQTCRSYRDSAYSLTKIPETKAQLSDIFGGLNSILFKDTSLSRDSKRWALGFVNEIRFESQSIFSDNTDCIHQGILGDCIEYYCILLTSY